MIKKISLRIGEGTSNQFKSGWETLKSLPIAWIIGMICVPVITAVLPLAFSEGVKDRKIEEQTSDLISLRTELSLKNDEVVQIREEYEKLEMRERLLERKLGTKTTVEIGLQQRVESLESQLNSKRLDFNNLRNEFNNEQQQFRLLSEYVKDLEEQIADLKVSRSRLENMLRDRSKAEQRSLLECRAVNQGTYKIAGLFVPATILHLNLTGRSLVTTDIEKIVCLRRLRSLALSNIQSRNIDFLSILKDLQSLTLYDSQILSFEFLIGVNDLSNLNVRGSVISSFSGIEKITSLNRLGVANIIGRPDLGAISKIPNLRSLDLTGTHPNDFRFLSDIPELRELFLKDTINVDLSILRDLKNLHRIILPNGEEIGGYKFNLKNRSEVYEYIEAVALD